MAAGDAFRQVRQGDPLRFPAEMYNQLLDMLRWFKGQQLPGGGASPDGVGRVLVKNTTGSAVGRGTVLKVNGSLLTATADVDAWRERPALTGTTPDGSGTHCVTLEGIPAGEVGAAAISGHAQVVVNVTDATHAYAAATSGDATKLTSGTSGEFTIVQKPGGTGDKYCTVRFGGVAAASGGGASITVEDEDGTPSYSGIEYLQFKQADGFALSLVASNVALVEFNVPTPYITVSGTGMSVGDTDGLDFTSGDYWSCTRSGGGSGTGVTVAILPATASNDGLMSNDTQTFAGAKTFQNAVTVEELRFNDTSGYWSGNSIYGGIQYASTGTLETNAIIPKADNTHDLGSSAERWKDVWAANGTIQTSDARQKRDVSDADLGLAFVCDLRPVSYRWVSGRDGVRFGVLAHELATALGRHGRADADMLFRDADGVPSGLNYVELIAPLVAAVQELAGRVAALEAAGGSDS